MKNTILWIGNSLRRKKTYFIDLESWNTTYTVKISKHHFDILKTKKETMKLNSFEGPVNRNLNKQWLTTFLVKGVLFCDHVQKSIRKLN